LYHIALLLQRKAVSRDREGAGMGIKAATCVRVRGRRGACHGCFVGHG